MFKINELKESIPSEIMTKLKNRLNILGLSGGKDSVATAILLYYLHFLLLSLLLPPASALPPVHQFL
mgnify:CR=1 FL=1